MAGSSRSVKSHFERSAPNVLATYDRILAEAQRLGQVREEAKKTSIHLVNGTAFAGVAVQKAALVLTLKAARDISNKRIRRREQLSANRWHVEVRLERPEEVDAQLREWLQEAYSLAR